MDLLILLIELACDMDDTRFILTGYAGAGE